MAIVRSGGVRVPRLEGGGEGSPEETDEEGGESPATLLQEYDAAASFSGEEEEEEENGGGGEEEGEEEEEEDSGMGSDELEITELGEAGAELCQVGDQSVAVPLELYDLPGLGGVLSLDAWNGLLSEDERLRLAAFLPDMDQETFARTLVELLSGSNFHFGSPLAALFNQLKGALCDPRIVLYRRGVRFAERRKHYYWLQSYHNSMVRQLWDIKDCWNVCEGYSLEERLHALDGMKAQQQQKQDWGLGLRGPAGSETDSESRESGERFLTRQKTEKAGLKKGRKYGKDKSKGLLRVGVSKGLAEEHIGGAGRDAAMALSELSRHDRVRGYDSGVVRGGKLQRGADGLDPEELGYDRDLQRDRYAAQKPMLKPRKKKGLAASYDIDMYEKDYPDSHAGSPYYHGKNVSANQGVTLAAYNPPYFETGKNAKYQERDWMYGGKGVPNKALRGDQMDWPAGSRTDNLGDWQRGKPTVDCRSGKAQAGYGLKSKSYKSIEQHFNDASFGSDPRGKILQGKTKGKSSSRYDRLGQKYSNSGTIYPQSEETESDSSEQFEDSGHTNLLGQQPDLHHYGSRRPSYDAKRPNKLPKGVKRDYSGVAADFEHYQTKGIHKGKVGEPGYLRDVHVTMKDQISEMMRPQAVRGERKRKGMTDLDMYGYGISEMHDSKENVKETFRSLESESLASRSGYGVQDSNGDFGGLERVRVPLSGCSSSAKKQKGKVQVMSLDEHGEYLPSGSKQQMDNSGSSKKKGKRKPETLTDAVTVAAPPAPVLPENSVVVVEPEKPQKKYVPITPTIHTGFSFSIVHLLSAVRKAMVTPTEDTSVAGKHPSGEDSKTKLNNEERNKTLQGPSATQQTQQGHEATDASAAEQTVLSDLPALTVQELVNKIKSNPGDPCILETQEPLQDLVRGVLKILSSKTAPLGAKGWKALVSYDKSNKSWFWVGPLASGSSGNDPIEEETSAEAWGIPHKMLVKLVDAFANWLKSGQETLKQIGSLPSPPPPNPANLDLKERFKDLRAQKSLNTISPSSDEARAYFQREEFLRYSIPDRAFCYTAADGEKSIVAPLRRGGGKPTAKARGHPMLLPDRPPHVTILCLVRDAAARLPARTGTRADVCTLLKDSQYLNQEEANKEAAINQVVSGALDRLHYERDPCVLYDNDKKLWTYLHRGREEEDFEDDGTSSTKKWKRPRKDPSDPAEPGAANDDIDDEGTPSTNSAKKTRKVPIDPAASGPAKDAADNASQDPSAGGFSGGLEGDPDLNVIPSTINGEETSGTVYTDAKSDIGSSSAAVDTTPGSRAEGNSVGWQAFPGQDNNMVLPDSTKGIS